MWFCNVIELINICIIFIIILVKKMNIEVYIDKKKVYKFKLVIKNIF